MGDARMERPSGDQHVDQSLYTRPNKAGGGRDDIRALGTKCGRNMVRESGRLPRRSIISEYL
jgi:hypothetical protein